MLIRHPWQNIKNEKSVAKLRNMFLRKMLVYVVNLKAILTISIASNYMELTICQLLAMLTIDNKKDEQGCILFP